MGKYSTDSESGSSNSYRRKNDRYRKGRHRSSSRSSSSSKYGSKSRRNKKSKRTRPSRSRDRHIKHSRRRSRDRHRGGSRSSSEKRGRSRSRSKRSRSYSARRSWSKNRGRLSNSPSHRRSRSNSRGRRRYTRSRTRTRSISPRRSDLRNINKANDFSSRYSPKDDGSELLEKLNKAAVQLMSETAKETNSNIIEAQVQREAIINEINSPAFAPKSFVSNETKLKDFPTVVELHTLTPKLSPLKEVPGSLLHPNVCLLLEDQGEKLNRWVRKVYQLRQRSLNGEPLTLA